MQVPFFLAASKRSLSPEAVLLNCYPEKAPTQQETDVALRSRGGLEAFKTVGDGPIRGLYTKQGLFDNAAIVVSAQSVYTLTSAAVATQLTGSLAGDDLVDIDAGQDADLNSVARIATGSALYKVMSGLVTLENFPAAGGAGASSVCYHRGFWLASEAGTDQVYYQVPGDTVWSALSFASAEYSPDKIVAIRTLGDQIWLLGETTTEAWALTGSASPAIEPYGGLNFDFGCRSRNAAVSMPNALVFVDSACQVRLSTGGAPAVISDAGLSEQIRGVSAADLRGAWYQVDGHSFYVLTLGTTATWVYDLTTQHWHRRNSLGYAYLRGNLFATLGDTVLCADTISAQIWRLDPDSRTDAGTSFTVEFMAYRELLEGAEGVANLELVCEVGDAPRSGQGSAPVIAMRISDDGAKTWGNWRERGLGATGDYAARVRWNALGTTRAPRGRFYHFQVSDPVGRRFSSARVNTP